MVKRCPVVDDVSDVKVLRSDEVRVITPSLAGATLVLGSGSRGVEPESSNLSWMLSSLARSRDSRSSLTLVLVVWLSP